MPRATSVRVEPGQRRGGDGRQRVGDVEGAGHRAPRRRPAGRRGPSTVKRAPSPASSTSTARQSASRPPVEKVCIGMPARSSRRRPCSSSTLVRPEPGALGGEERRLGGEVVLDVGVEVEVVAAEVEEGRDVEDHAVDPAEHQGVAGDLHRAGDDALLAHHREEPVQVGGLGGGQRRLDVDAVDAGADGADDRGGYAGLLEAGLQQPGRRGLALGAGHADHREVGGGLAVEVGRHPAEHRRAAARRPARGCRPGAGPRRRRR